MYGWFVGGLLWEWPVRTLVDSQEGVWFGCLLQPWLVGCLVCTCLAGGVGMARWFSIGVSRWLCRMRMGLGLTAVGASASSVWARVVGCLV